MDQLERAGDGFKTGFKTKSDGPLPIKLTWWKCWFWWLIPGVFLGTDDRIRFHGWDIGHCLNCDADPYDGQVEAWSYDGNWFRGALIRCNRCGQLRWQPGESGRDYQHETHIQPMGVLENNSKDALQANGWKHLYASVI